MLILDERLSLCASYVRESTALADVGTDHAYLPVWLSLNKRIRSAVASDVRKGPLGNAEKNIKFYGVGDIVKTVLSDGLDSVSPDEADDIVIAGMGGELIVSIIDRTAWLSDTDKRLILQPMTRSNTLRKYLYENGFVTDKEEACVSGVKAYSVICCHYDGIVRKPTLEEEYLGSLALRNAAPTRKYASVLCAKLKNIRKGVYESSELYSEYTKLIEKLDDFVDAGGNEK